MFLFYWFLLFHMYIMKSLQPSKRAAALKPKTCDNVLGGSEACALPSSGCSIVRSHMAGFLLAATHLSHTPLYWVPLMLEVFPLFRFFDLPYIQGLLFISCVFCWQVSMHLCAVSVEGRRGGSDSRESELLTVSCRVGAGSQTGYFARVDSTRHCWAISPASCFSFDYFL